MADDVYYLDGARNQQGPVPGAEVARLIRNGAIRRDTLVWYAGMPEWRPAGQVNDFASLFAQAAAPPQRPPAAPSPQGFAAAAAMPRRGPSAAGAYPGQAAQVQARQYDAPKSMGFGGAIATCFRKYVDFSGRARRPEYWWFMLFYWLVLVGLSIVDAIIIGTRGGAGVFTGLAVLAMFLPTLSVGVRRLHDTDRTGWWLLIGIIPLIGGIVLLVFMCLRGTDGPNRFGPDSDSVAVAEAFS